MSLPRDLLDQAELLAKKERRRPKQASLRRAISTAYYALFHLLIEDAANALSPATPSALRRIVARAFQHAQIKTACKDFVQADAAVLKAVTAGSATPLEATKNLPNAIKGILVFPFQEEFRSVLSTFVDLQEARHTADYDLSESWNRIDVLSHVLSVRAAFTAWSKIRKTENAAIFMTVMLLRKDLK